MKTKKFDLIGLVDADIVFMRPHIPLSSLFERWGAFTNETHIVAAAVDPKRHPDTRYTYKSQKLDMINTGLMFWKTSDRAQTLVDYWSTCLEKGDAVCLDTAFRFYQDQSGFNKVIRVDRMLPNELVIIPCDDANGYSSENGGTSGCNGKIISHFWNRKEEFPAFSTVMSKISAELRYLAQRGVARSVVHTHGADATFLTPDP